MKSTIVLIAILSLYAIEVMAGPSCDVEKFKRQYIDLQNALRYKGSKIELKKGRIVPTSEQVSNDDSPGKKAEQILYNNYVAALQKVKKIYEHLNSNSKASNDEKTILANDDVTKFFKAIDPKKSNSSSLDVNIDKLIDQLKKVKDKSFSLNENDIYLLKKLIAHSQDRVCTLERYIQNNQATKDKYLDDLKKAPLNKMIEQLRNLMNTDDIQFAVQDLAIEKAVEDGVNNLHQMAKDCKNTLYTIKFDEPIQSCNYNKFIRSLTVDDAYFKSFEAILHFINANQKATNANTSLDFLNLKLSDKAISCVYDVALKAMIVKNLPLKNNEIDPKILKCVKSGKNIEGEDCLNGMKINLNNKKGYLFTPEPNSGIEKLSIAGAINCENVAFAPLGTTQPQNNEADDKIRCESDPKKFWKDKKCLTKIEDQGELLPIYRCSKEECSSIKKPNSILNWNEVKKTCEASSLEGRNPAPICSLDGVVLESLESCKSKNQEFNSIDKTCIETAQSCSAKKLAFDPTSKKCTESVETCKAKNLAFDSVKKQCSENEETCRAKKLVLDSTTKQCAENDDTCKVKNLAFDSATKQCTESELTCKTKNLSFDSTKKQCFENEETCKAKGLDFDKDKKICSESSQNCEKKKLAFDGSTRTCVEDAQTCKNKGKTFDEQSKQCKDIILTEEECNKQSKKLNEAKNECIALTKEEECNKKNNDAISNRKPGDDVTSMPFEWKNSQCTERKPKKDVKKEGEDDSEEKTEKESAVKNKPLPPRYQPIAIPSRQMYILPGMP